MMHCVNDQFRKILQSIEAVLFSLCSNKRRGLSERTSECLLKYGLPCRHLTEFQ